MISVYVREVDLELLPPENLEDGAFHGGKKIGWVFLQGAPSVGHKILYTVQEGEDAGTEVTYIILDIWWSSMPGNMIAICQKKVTT